MLRSQGRVPVMLFRGILLIASMLPAASHAQGALQEVMDSDRNFAERSRDRGQQSAFEAFLAPGSVLFRPTAVDGMQWVSSHEPAAGRLDWMPLAGATSCAGGLAVTTGHWNYFNESDGAAAEGYYLTVWRADSEPRWRVLLDHGINTPVDGDADVALVKVLQSFRARSASRGCKNSAARAGLARAEQSLNEQIASRGLAVSLRDWLWQGAIAFRDGRGPVPYGDLGNADGFEESERLDARSQGLLGEAAGDFGVTYGELRAKSAPSERPARLWVYIRVWIREDRRWQIAMEMLVPVSTDDIVD
jgi:ketosteroid isomerase-like protein